MRAIMGAALGAALAGALIWLYFRHYNDGLAEAVNGLLSAAFGGALSFAGGYTEHRRSARAAARDANARPRDAGGQ